MDGTAPRLAVPIAAELYGGRHPITAWGVSSVQIGGTGAVLAAHARHLVRLIYDVDGTAFAVDTTCSVGHRADGDGHELGRFDAPDRPLLVLDRSRMEWNPGAFPLQAASAPQPARRRSGWVRLRYALLASLLLSAGAFAYLLFASPPPPSPNDSFAGVWNNLHRRVSLGPRNDPAERKPKLDRPAAALSQYILDSIRAKNDATQNNTARRGPANPTRPAAQR